MSADLSPYALAGRHCLVPAHDCQATVTAWRHAADGGVLLDLETATGDRLHGVPLGDVRLLDYERDPAPAPAPAASPDPGLRDIPPGELARAVLTAQGRGERVSAAATRRLAELVLGREARS